MKCDDGFEWLKKKIYGNDGLSGDVDSLKEAVFGDDDNDGLVDIVDYHESFIGKILDGQTIEPEYDEDTGSYLYELPEGTRRVFVKGTLDGTLEASAYVEFQDANGKMFARGSVSANKKHWLLDAVFSYDVQTGTVADYGFYVENTTDVISASTPLLVTQNLSHYIMLDPHDFSAFTIKVPAGLENNLTLSAYPN